MVTMSRLDYHCPDFTLRLKCDALIVSQCYLLIIYTVDLVAIP